MNTQNLYLKFEEQVKTFSQSELIEKTRSLFQKEKSIEDALIIVLSEIYRRRVYAEMGYSSLFDLLTQYFHLSAANAFQKIAAIKFITQVPVAKDKLLNGETNVSQLAILNSHIHNAEKQNELKMESGEKESLLHNVLGLSNVETKKKLDEAVPLPLPPLQDKTRVVKNDLVHIACTISKEVYEKIQYLKSLQSHKNPNPNMAELIEMMTDLAIENLETKKGIREPNVRSKKNTEESEVQKNDENNHKLMSQFNTRGEQNGESRSHSTDERCVTKSEKKQTRYISRDVKRAVIRRAQNQCEFVSREGRRCECRTRLQFEHKTPWSLGGDNTIDNIFYYCFEHNQFTAHQFFKKDPREYPKC